MRRVPRVRPIGPHRHSKPLRHIPDLHLRPVRFGSERPDDTAVGAIVWLLGALQALTGLFGLARYVRRQRITIIHTSDRPRDALLCVFLARLTGAKCIIQVHVGYGDWMSPLLKWALKRADALIAVSSFVAATLNDSRLRHRPDPRRAERHRSRAMGTRGRPRRRPPGVRCRRRRADRADRVPALPREGTGIADRAMAAIIVDHPDVHLLIVGQEMVRGFAAALSDLAERLGMNEQRRVYRPAQRHRVA